MLRLRRKIAPLDKLLSSSPVRVGLGERVENEPFYDPVPTQNADDLKSGRFVFINETTDLGLPVDWAARGQGKLWQYNLHYFDWLWSLLPSDGGDWSSARRMVMDWISANPRSTATNAWEPYPVSLRLINWSLLFGVRQRQQVEKDGEFQQQLMASISDQACWLNGRLETHLLANHLLENLVALWVVGRVFSGSDARKLVQNIQPKLKRELKEQILPDGMHYERSPMYHLRILWLVDVLTKLADGVFRDELEEMRTRMIDALTKLRHPDGEIALFNDAAIGIYADAWRGRAPKMGAWSLPDAGYYGYRSETGDYLIADAGAVGPDYQPGHAHADYLSFELSLDGRRVITDTGVGTYEIGKQRSYDRSTAAHNTVEIEGTDSAEVWGGFRVGRRVVPKVLRWEPHENGMVLEAEHRGYQHLPGKPVHRRRFEMGVSGLLVMDTVEASQTVSAKAHWHFSPAAEVRIENKIVVARQGGLEHHLSISGVGDLQLETHQCCEHFGNNLVRSVVAGCLENVVATEMAHSQLVCKSEFRKTDAKEPMIKSDNQKNEA